MTDLRRNSLVILAENAAGTLSTVLVDESRRLVSVFTGSEGATVKQKATGELITEIQGSESLAVKQKASTGELVSVIQGDQGADVSQDASGALVSKIQGSEDIAIKQKASTGEMIAEMQGSEGVAVKQEATGELISVMQGSQNADILQDATGALVSLMKGVYGATPTTISVDVNGNMVAVMKGNYSGSLTTIATDVNGRLSADFGLYEQATFDMDTYAEGTDSRISLSSSVGMVLIKYWMNVQNQLIAIRHIDLQGSASLGEYEINLASDDIIGGSTGVNTTLSDTKIYRKTISNSDFDYSETNCSFKGFIVDYLLNPSDISSDYSIITGGTNPTNAFDDDLATYALATKYDTGYAVVFELSFSSRTIQSLHAMYGTYNSVNDTTDHLIQLEINGVWTTIFSGQSPSSSLYMFYKHSVTVRNIVTGFRIQLQSTTIRTSTILIYDISIFD